MSKGLSYDIIPRMGTIRGGSLLKARKGLNGTNAVGVLEEDDDKEFGADEVFVDAGSTCLYVEDEQFYTVDKETGQMCAFVRARLIAGSKIIYYSLVCHKKRLWDFETFRGKQRIIQAAIDDANSGNAII